MHPYTKLLLSAVPNPNAGLHSHRLAPRPKTDLAVDLVGCRFAERCPLAVASCVSDPPALAERRPNHLVRCPIIDPST
jgi:oligopeptide/dipeptide ABC transporter ATP-binding protein